MVGVTGLEPATSTTPKSSKIYEMPINWGFHTLVFVATADILGYLTYILTYTDLISFQPTMYRLFNQGLDSKDSQNRVVIHTLRHTFASHLAINNTSLFTIQKLMNHADIEHTQRYAKLAPDSGAEMVRNLYR